MCIGITCCVGTAICCAGQACCSLLCCACKACGVHGKNFARIGYVFFQIFFMAMSLLGAYLTEKIFTWYEWDHLACV
jgi:hypothetical protein